MDEYEIKAVVGWQEYECDRFFGDQYLAYLAACAKVNTILDGEYGRSREFTDYLESWGYEFSPNAQMSRYDNASPAALTAVYIALNDLQPGIHFCREADSKPENCFYDPGVMIQGRSVYVW